MFAHRQLNNWTIAAAAVIMLLGAAEPTQADDWGLWHGSREVIFSGYAGGDPLVNFPALVRINPSDHPDMTRDDLRFADADGDSIPFEIDEWDDAGESLIWVKVPSISSATDSVTMYWNYTGDDIPPAPDAAEAWHDDFQGVWHLGDAVDGEVPDSTSLLNHATNHDTTVTTGRIGSARSFIDGVQCVEAPSSDGDELDITGDMTLSAWVNLDSWGLMTSQQCIIGHETFTGGYSLYADGERRALLMRFPITGFVVSQTNALQTKVWHHIVVSVSGSTVTFYIDGEQQGTGTVTSRSSADQNVCIGAKEASSPQPLQFDGVIDEVRIASAARPSSWAKAGFDNQKASPTFIELGDIRTHVSVAAEGDDAVAGEDGAQGAFTFSRTGDLSADLTIDFAVSGTAEQDVDYELNTTPGLASATIPANEDSVTVIVNPLDDLEVEGDEDVTLTIQPGEYVVSRPDAATVTIAEDDHVKVDVAAGDAEASEEGDAASFVISRVTDDPASPVTVHFALSGSALQDVDYDLDATPGLASVTIPPNEDSVTVVVNPLDDPEVEGDEDVTLTIQPSEYIVGSAEATVTISDDDSWGDWPHKIMLTFDTSGLTEPLTDFPVLVKLTGNRTANYVDFLSGGTDVRFRDGAETTVLPHEIEQWRDGQDESFIWVKVPEISPANDHIWMYWGNPAATTGAQKATEVWTSDYSGVWHLHADSLLDSTMNANDGTDAGTEAAPGAIASGRLFTGGHIVVPSTAGDELDLVDDMTVSAWINISEWGGDDVMGCLLSRPADGGYSLYDFKPLMGLQFIVPPDSMSFSDPGVLTRFAWSHVAASISGATATFYVNGVPRGTATVVDRASSDHDVLIGSDATSGGAASPFLGKMDEVRLAAASRSPEWINAQYHSMNDAFIDYPQLANAGGPYTVAPGEAVQLDAAMSQPLANIQITAYRWDLDGDGNYDDAEGVVPDAVPLDFFTGEEVGYSVGEHPVGLQVVYGDALHTATDATVLTLVGAVELAPTASEIEKDATDELTVTLNPPAPDGGATVTLDYDPDFLSLDADELLFPAGDSEASVTVTAVAETETTTIVASAEGYLGGEVEYIITAVEATPGDVNSDGCVNITDLLVVRNNLGNFGSDITPPEADIIPAGDPDGVVNIADLLFVRNQMGEGPTCQE